MTEETEVDSENPDDADDAADAANVRFVGPATVELIGDADFSVSDIPEKRVSYRQLLDAGVNPGVATKIRREHSLPWTFEGSDSDDLSRRSEQIRGLQDEERAWVAASTGDWESTSPGTGGSRSSSGADAEADGSGETAAEEAAWRERSQPRSVTEVSGISEEETRKLAKAGINSVRSLASADPEMVADVLDLDIEQVTEWCEQAAELA